LKLEVVAKDLLVDSTKRRVISTAAALLRSTGVRADSV
jgi:hypothetical protein